MCRLSLRAGLPVLALALAAAACGESPAAPAPADSGPARFLIVSGNGQTGAAGEELPQPLVVRAVNGSGDPVPGRHVGFTVVAGGGELYVGGGVTDAAGIVKDYWTLGRVAGDSQRVEARSVDPSTGAKQVLGVFTARAVPGEPAAAVPHQTKTCCFGGVVRTMLPDTFQVALVDRFGNRVLRPRVIVRWLASHGGNVSVSSSLTATDTNGVARTRWWMGTVAAEQTLSTQVSGFPPRVAFTGNARAGAPAVVAFSHDSVNVSAFGTVPLTATATDAYGNRVSYTLASLGAAVSVGYVYGQPPYLYTYRNGVARVVATAGALTDTAVVVVQQVAASIVFRAIPPTLEIGATLPMSWYSVIRDANDYTIGGVRDAWTSTSPAVASVNSRGIVTGVTEGTFTILVSRDGVTRETATITVVP